LVTFLVAGLLLVATGSAPAALAQAAPHCDPGQSPEFVFGFADLKAEIGDVMGNPVSCQYADPNGTGDTLQDTSTGLAFWRKSINTPTFTNGATYWALVDIGLVSWTGPGTTSSLVYVPGVTAIQPLSVSINLSDLSIVPEQAAQYVLEHPGTAFGFDSPSITIDIAFCAAASTLQPWIEAPSGRPDNAPMCVVQARGQFDTHHEPQGVPPITGNYSQVVFDGHTGNLLGSGCCSALPANLVPSNASAD